MPIRLSDLSATKLLWFGYILLYLALAYLGLALARIADRLSLADGFLLLIVILLPMLVSILVSIYWLIRLVWLFIAYDPDTESVSSEKLIMLFTVLTALILFNSTTHYITSLPPSVHKSAIVFNDPVVAVQDSMLAFRRLCTTIDSSRFASCYVRDQDSTLVFISPQLDATTPTFSTWGRIDTVTTANGGLRYVPPTNRARFIRQLRFLNRNLISGIRHDRWYGFWLYTYGENSHDGDDWHRDLLIYDTPADTLSSMFRALKSYDRKQRIILVGYNRPRTMNPF